MKNYVLILLIMLFTVTTHAQEIKATPLKPVCNNPEPLQQIGGSKIIRDRLLVYQICIDSKLSDNANPQLSKHLVGLIKVTNNSKSVYQVAVYYFWKGNQVNTKLVKIKPNQSQLYPFNLLAKKGKENENSSVEARSEQTKKIISLIN